MNLSKSDDEIKKIFNRLGESPMKEGSHGFEKYGNIKIREAAKKQSLEFLNSENKTTPAIRLMDVILAANRNYNKQVAPHIAKIKLRYPDLTFNKLQRMLSENDFLKFKEIWGHADEKKYNTLKTVVNIILTFSKSNSIEEDFQIMKKWANDAKLEKRKQDNIGGLKNIGIATFQHLRISFGIDTVKPDQRVKEVLNYEFGLNLSSENAILAVEKIAQILKLKVIEVDQIFVKYGSGYY